MHSVLKMHTSIKAQYVKKMQVFILN